MSALLLCAMCLGLPSAPSPAPRVLLSPIFSDTCRRPCEYVGFSFDDTLEGDGNDNALDGGAGAGAADCGGWDHGGADAGNRGAAERRKTQCLCG